LTNDYSISDAYDLFEWPCELCWELMDKSIRIGDSGYQYCKASVEVSRHKKVQYTLCKSARDVEANRNWKIEALKNAKSSRESPRVRAREKELAGKERAEEGMREMQDNVWEREVEESGERWDRTCPGQFSYLLQARIDPCTNPYIMLLSTDHFTTSVC
jgi:hypothetical protein